MSNAERALEDAENDYWSGAVEGLDAAIANDYERMEAAALEMLGAARRAKVAQRYQEGQR